MPAGQRVSVQVPQGTVLRLVKDFEGKCAVTGEILQCKDESHNKTLQIQKPIENRAARAVIRLDSLSKAVSKLRKLSVKAKALRRTSRSDLCQLAPELVAIPESDYVILSHGTQDLATDNNNETVAEIVQETAHKSSGATPDLSAASQSDNNEKDSKTNGRTFSTVDDPTHQTVNTSEALERIVDTDNTLATIDEDSLRVGVCETEALLRCKIFDALSLQHARDEINASLIFLAKLQHEAETRGTLQGTLWQEALLKLPQSSGRKSRQSIRMAGRIQLSAEDAAQLVPRIRGITELLRIKIEDDQDIALGRSALRDCQIVLNGVVAYAKQNSLDNYSALEVLRKW